MSFKYNDIKRENWNNKSDALQMLVNHLYNLIVVEYFIMERKKGEVIVQVKII